MADAPSQEGEPIPHDEGLRERALACLKAHGRHATSFQILESGYDYWFDPSEDGVESVVAYVCHGRYRVVAGVPIAPEAAEAAVAARFIDHAAAAGRRVLFFGVEDDFIVALRAHPGASAVHAVKIGEQPEWEPRQWAAEGPDWRHLRPQFHRAINKGVRVRRVDPEEVAHAPGPLRAEIESVLSRWLASRRMSAMGFMVDLQPFHLASERRYYVAEQGDRAVGFLAAVPVYGRRGWFFEDVIRVPDAPNGTVELLVDAAMTHAAEAGDAYVTLGLAPLTGLDGDDGPGGPLGWAMGGFYRRASGLYNFQGLRAFKDRFRPDRWVSQYLVASPGRVGVGAFHALLSAFAGDGLLAFGVDTLRRGLARLPRGAWASAFALLALLLVPWTLMLAAADGVAWFGATSIQAAWVVFDSALVVAVGSLAWLVWRRRPSARPLAFFLAGATFTDFLLTISQALHLHRDPTGWEGLLVAIGVMGPLLASALLAGLAWVTPSPRRRSSRGGRRTW